VPKFEITRTQMHTRVWVLEAETLDAAIQRYLEEDDDEELAHYSGHPSMTVKQIGDNSGNAQRLHGKR